LEFKAELVDQGTEFKIHHLHTIDLQKTGNSKKLD